MRKARNDRGRSRSQLLATSLGALTILAVMVAAAVAVGGLFRAGAQARTRAERAGAGGPAATEVLHLRGARSDAGGRAAMPTLVEAWLDETTHEGKIIETGPDGVIRRIVSFSGDTHVLYLGDAHHAVIRQGLGPNSPIATSVRDELLRYHVSVQRGAGRVIGSGRVGERHTHHVQIEVDGKPVVAEVDQATGLALREEATQSNGERSTRETTYSTVERVSRAGLPADVFQVKLPPGTTREEYTEGPTHRVDTTSPAGLPYAVYAAPASVGASVAAFRRASTAPNGFSSDVYYLIYRTPDGEVQVLSGLPPAAPTGSGKGDPMDGNRPQTIQIAGVNWEVAASAREVQGRATLGDAYVTIYAPNQAVFERVAASLVRLDQR